MDRDLYNYECHNCKYTFSSKVHVDTVVQCLRCKDASVCLKPQFNGVCLEKLENKNVVGVLSKFSTEELIEALNQKEDVQVYNTTEDTYKVSMNLMEVKKHVLVISNCKPQLVEHRRRVVDAEIIQFADGRCD
ncbi:hypothetical protein [Bacillus toyonensis]|uniref:hypothetical protein n=1 Tax=Bacillus toyonensis TaxID=155322 RepID=UPI002175728D|nr:hypothetical protein [Bacillus toyonensis]